jgi:hypothetical protein
MGVRLVSEQAFGFAGIRTDARLRSRWPNIVPVHTPVHASWLNQVEVYFSIVQRKVLDPNDFHSIEEVSERLLGFERHYEAAASPFQWKYTRQDLKALLAKLRAAEELQEPRAAA